MSRKMIVGIVKIALLVSLVVLGSGLVTPTGLPTTDAASKRWVMETERGFIFSWHDLQDVPNIGALVFTPNNMHHFAYRMQPAALKIPQGRLTMFSSSDENLRAYFPWNEFVAFNEAEMAAGRPPLWITANGEPVLSYTDPDSVRQVMNVGDERFIDFWINNYVRKRLMSDLVTGEPYPYDNIWIGIDQGIFMQRIFEPATGWDEPFPQNNDEYVESVKYFFRRLKELAPDIRVIVNGGSLVDESTFPEVFADVDGYMAERYPYADLTDPYKKEDSIRTLHRLIWYGEQGRVTMVKTMIPMDNRIDEHVRNAYMAYLIARGDNSFFGPHAGETANALPESYYIEMQQELGWHTGPAQEIQPNVWMRPHQGGLVYLNWSESPLTFEFPEGYADRDGVPITSLTLQPNTGDYVLTIQANSLP